MLCFEVFAMQNSLANWQTQVARLSLSWTTVCHPAAPQLSIPGSDKMDLFLILLATSLTGLENGRSLKKSRYHVELWSFVFDWQQDKMSPSHKLCYHDRDHNIHLMSNPEKRREKISTIIFSIWKLYDSSQIRILYGFFAPKWNESTRWYYLLYLTDNTHPLKKVQEQTKL